MNNNLIFRRCLDFKYLPTLKNINTNFRDFRNKVRMWYDQLHTKISIADTKN